ncbi:hypothetical protein J5X84_07000 [Streptosporangiaceae bacterium NEAU-GS5]|nr:hypothetical protein [Streptosporangiaceae bacterium NEAU-GS5]
MTTARRRTAIVLPLAIAMIGFGVGGLGVCTPAGAVAITPAAASLPGAGSLPAVGGLAGTRELATTRASAAGLAASRAAAIDGKITSPGDGARVSDGRVSISATLSWVCQAKLTVDGEGVSGTTVAEGGNCLGNTTISGSFAPPSSAPNGSYKVTLKGSLTQTVFDSVSFVVSRPPATPSGVSAKLDGSSKAVVTWSKGEEPDLQDYRISATQGGASASVTADQACSGSSCQATLSLPAKSAGHKVGFSVKAIRADGAGGTIGSGSSSAAYVNVPAPKVTQKPSPRPSGSVKELPQLPAGPTHQAQRIALPKSIPTKAPKLPDPGKTDFTLPEVTQVPTAAPPKVAPVQAAADSSSSNGLRYGIYLAIGLLLLLVGAHIGAWIRRRTAPAGAAMTGQPVMRSGAKGAAAGAGAGVATVRRPTVILSRTKLSSPSPEDGVAAAVADAGPLALPPPADDLAPLEGRPLAPVDADEVGAVVAVVDQDTGGWDSYLPPQPRSLEDSGFWKSSPVPQDSRLTSFNSSESAAADSARGENTDPLYMGRRRLDDR